MDGSPNSTWLRWRVIGILMCGCAVTAMAADLAVSPNSPQCPAPSAAAPVSKQGSPHTSQPPMLWPMQVAVYCEHSKAEQVGAPAEPAVALRPKAAEATPTSGVVVPPHEVKPSEKPEKSKDTLPPFWPQISLARIASGVAALMAVTASGILISAIPLTGGDRDLWFRRHWGGFGAASTGWTISTVLVRWTTGLMLMAMAAGLLLAALQSHAPQS
jgi:hypothetical protein